MIATMLARLICPLVLALAPACSDDDSSAFKTAAADIEGIYQVQSHTENLQACSPGGDAITGPGYLVTRMVPIFGIPNLPLLACTDAANCRDLIDRYERGEGFSTAWSYAVQEVDAEGALTGTGASTGFNMSGTCTGGSITSTTITRTGNDLTLVVRRTLADDYPEDADGFCTTDLAQQAAAGNDCSQLVELTATFSEAL